MELRARDAGGRAGANPTVDSLPQAPRSFTVVHAIADRLWADWIVHLLRANGQRVAARRWDPALPGALEKRSTDEITQILLFSDRFFAAGTRSGIDWEENVATMRRAAHLPTAVVVGDCALPSAVVPLVPLDLRRLGEDAAKRALLSRLEVVSVPAGPGTATHGPRFPAGVPAVWDGVPRRNPRFTGRDALLVAVHDRLEAAPADTAVVALVGLPGIGKTQLAAEYAHRFAGRYDMVWWASGHDRPLLEGRLATLAPDSDSVRGALDALRRGDPYERWLLVLDGADDPGAIADLLPAGRGHVLITSRNRAWADHYAELLDVPPLSREESVAFVRLRALRLGAEDADRLAAAVEDLPLPLDQTAGWLHDSTTPVAEYVRMLSDGEPNPVRAAADYPMPYHSAFKDLITQLRETTKAAAELLSLCALFDPGPVPLALLRAVPADQVSPAVAALLENPSQLDLAMGKLVQRSVVRVADDAVWMSRFVRDAVRRRAPRNARLVRRALAMADPGRPDDPTTWPRYAELLPHLESSDTMSRGIVIDFVRYLTLSGDYERGMRLAERVGGDAHDLTVCRATLLRETGDYAKAEELDRSVLVDLVEADAPGAPLAMARLAGDLRGWAAMTRPTSWPASNATCVPCASRTAAWRRGSPIGAWHAPCGCADATPRPRRFPDSSWRASGASWARGRCRPCRPRPTSPTIYGFPAATRTPCSSRRPVASGIARFWVMSTRGRWPPRITVDCASGRMAPRKPDCAGSMTCASTRSAYSARRPRHPL